MFLLNLADLLLTQLPLQLLDPLLYLLHPFQPLLLLLRYQMILSVCVCVCSWSSLNIVMRGLDCDHWQLWGLLFLVGSLRAWVLEISGVTVSHCTCIGCLLLHSLGHLTFEILIWRDCLFDKGNGPWWPVLQRASMLYLQLELQVQVDNRLLWNRSSLWYIDITSSPFASPLDVKRLFTLTLWRYTYLCLAGI